MLPRILLGVLALGVVAVFVLSDRPWPATSMPHIDEIASLPDTAEVEAATGGAEIGVVLPVEREQELRPLEDQQALGSGSRLGYSYRETSLLKMPIWAGKELGFVKYVRAPDGYYAEPLSDEQLRRLAPVLGKDYSQSYVFPLWRHLWGWAFVLGFLAWLFLNHRAQVKWREESGMI